MATNDPSMLEAAALCGITIERIVNRALASGSFSEHHRKTILTLLYASRFSHRDLEAISRLQAAIDTGKVESAINVP